MNANLNKMNNNENDAAGLAIKSINGKKEETAEETATNE